MRRGHADIVRLLLDHGADVNVKNKAGSTPLAIAVEKGRKAIAELLRRHGARER